MTNLETATVGTRELDDEVLLACGWRTLTSEEMRAQDIDVYYQDFWIRPEDEATGKISKPLSPSRSVDDALMLVPEGYGWSVKVGGRNENEVGGITYEGRVWLFWNEGDNPLSKGSGSVHAFAATPALALCAAILKAAQ